MPLVFSSTIAVFLAYPVQLFLNLGFVNASLASSFLSFYSVVLNILLVVFLICWLFLGQQINKILLIFQIRIMIILVKQTCFFIISRILHLIKLLQVCILHLHGLMILQSFIPNVANQINGDLNSLIFTFIHLMVMYVYI